MKDFCRSDKIESALLAGLVCGALSGAGVLVWWLPLFSAAIFSWLFRKYAFITFYCAVIAGFSLALFYSSHYEKCSKRLSSEDNASGYFVLRLEDPRQSSVKNIGQPVMLAAELLRYKLFDSGKWKSGRCSVMVKLPGKMKDVKYGTVITGRGRIATSSDPGFSNYLKARNIVKCIYLYEAETKGFKDSFMASVLSVRDKVASRVLDKIENDNSRNLAAALFFGMTGGLNSDRRSAYVNTGTIHVFSVSGMHVAVLAFFLYMIFRFTGMRSGYILTLIFAGLYVLSTGASAPAVRAYFMLFVWGICNIFFLWMRPFSIFCWAASFLILLNPLLVLDVGARYSVVITGVLISVSENVSVFNKTEQLRRKYLLSGGRHEKKSLFAGWLMKMRFALMICVAAFFGGLAISLYHNGQFLLFSIPVNLLLSPFMSLFYLLLGVAMALPDCAFLLSWAFQTLQWFCEHASRLSYNLPAASPSAVGLWLYAALLFIFIRYGGKVRMFSGILLISLILRWVLIPFGLPEEILVYNSIRRPACILFANSARNRAIVVDPSSGAASSEIVRHLRKRGITRIESVIFSRNSIYTARGVRTLVKNMPVKNFCVPEVKRYDRRKQFYAYLDACGIKNRSKTSEKYKNLKIISQKGSVTLEYFKRCAKLKDVLVLNELPDGRKLEMNLHKYGHFAAFMPFSSRERIYRYEFGK